MAVHVLDAMAREGFEEVIALHDHQSGLRAFLAIHDTSAGPALGGIRRLVYRDEKGALLDCLRLALHMSFKCVLAQIPGGGAKTVILDSPELDLEAVYRTLGDAIERLGGRYLAGPDVGTSEREMDWVLEQTRFATRTKNLHARSDLGVSSHEPRMGASIDLAEATAGGVFAGMEAGLEALDGKLDWERRRVVVQGLGNVGAALAVRLMNAGAHVLASDLDDDVARRVQAELGVELLEPGLELSTPCDIFAPCAMGGILHDVSIPKLRARIVCGAANNQLTRARHAVRMHARGILYLPDFVVNAGAVMCGSEFYMTGVPIPLARVEERIGRVAREVLAAARAADEAPARSAERKARLALAERKRRASSRPARSVAARAAPGQARDASDPAAAPSQP